MNVFRRCGLAALFDLETNEWREIFALLEEDQKIFLSKEPEFRSKDYKWPRDPLHNWSRVWEYPYVYYHIVDHIKNTPSNDSKFTVADIGSGVTFLPFSLAKRGCKVICTDIDSVCERDFFLACKCVPHSPGTVDFRLIQGSHIPLADSECDVVYCISVLEHVSDFEKTIDEIVRILKPEGLCLITCDINLKPEDGLQFDVNRYRRLRSIIEKKFLQVMPEPTIHPVDVLTTKRSLYPLFNNKLGIIGIAWHAVKQKIIKPILGRKPGKIEVNIPYLAVMGLVLKKRV